MSEKEKITRGAVTLADLSYGWRLERMPVVTGMCQMLKCSRCSEVCPSGALIRFGRDQADRRTTDEHTLAHTRGNHHRLL